MPPPSSSKPSKTQPRALSLSHAHASLSHAHAHTTLTPANHAQTYAARPHQAVQIRAGRSQARHHAAVQPAEAESAKAAAKTERRGGRG